MKFIIDASLIITSLIMSLNYLQIPSKSFRIIKKVELFLKILCSEGFENLCSPSKKEWVYMTIFVYLVTIPFALIRNLRKFVIVNFLSVAANVFLTILLFIFLFNGVFEKNIPIVTDNTLRKFNFEGILKTYGLSITSLESVSLLFPIRNKVRKKEDFLKIFSIACAVILTINISTAISAYFVNFIYK